MIFDVRGLDIVLLSEFIVFWAMVISIISSMAWWALRRRRRRLGSSPLLTILIRSFGVLSLLCLGLISALNVLWRYENMSHVDVVRYEAKVDLEMGGSLEQAVKNSIELETIENKFDFWGRRDEPLVGTRARSRKPQRFDDYYRGMYFWSSTDLARHSIDLKLSLNGKSADFSQLAGLRASPVADRIVSLEIKFPNRNTNEEAFNDYLIARKNLTDLGVTIEDDPHLTWDESFRKRQAVSSYTGYFPLQKFTIDKYEIFLSLYCWSADSKVTIIEISTPRNDS